MFSLKKSYSVLTKTVRIFPETLVVLGSGWNHILENVNEELRIDYKALFGVGASVPGHTGELIIGELNKKRVAFMSGRFHMYEGYSAFEATAPIRLFAQAGVKNIVLTAACGALNDKYRVGDVVILNDMVTLFLALDNPLIGPRFIDVSCVFDRGLRNWARKIAEKEDISFKEGVYAYYHGPNYETPADKRALKILGADVCGMSTVPETLVARSLDMKVLGLAFVTNLAFVKHDHKEVLKEAEKGGKKMVMLLSRLVPSLS